MSIFNFFLPVRLSIVMALTLTFGQSVFADTVKMVNGELLQGTIIEENTDYVLFRSTSFGEIKINRAQGLEITRISSTASATKPNMVAPAVQISLPKSSPGAPVTPGFLQKTLGLSDRWSAEIEGNMMQQKDRFNNRLQGLDFNLNYKVPNEEKPTQPLHEISLFSSYNFQKFDSTVVGQSLETVARYFYQPISSWLLISQADWKRDRINNIEARSNILAIPAYRFIDIESTRMLAGLGAGYHYDSRIAPDSFGTKFNQVSGLRMAFYQLLRHKLAPKLTLQQTLVYLTNPIDPATTYNLRFQISLKRMLTEHVSLNLSEEYTRDENKDTPIESISLLKVMLGYSF